MRAVAPASRVTCTFARSCSEGLASRVHGVDRSFSASPPSGSLAGTPGLHLAGHHGLTAVADLDVLHRHDLLATGAHALERHEALLKGRHNARRSAREPG